MTLTQLEYIVAVQKYGSFVQAARHLNVSQPTLSEMIGKLEKELEVVIFDRKKNPLQVTSIGQEIIHQAKQSLTQVSYISEIVQSYRNEIKGELRIGIIPTLAPSMIRLFLGTFKAKYPDVNISIFEEGTDSLVKLIENGELEVAILATPESAPPNLIVKPLFYEKFLLYASKENKLLKKKSVHSKDLENQKIVLMDETHCVREQIESLCDLSKRKDISQTTVHGGISTLISVVDEEKGFTFLPELLKDHVSGEQLRHFEDSKYHRKVSMILNKTYLKRKTVDLLAEEILHNLPEDIQTNKTKSVKVTDPDQTRF